MAPWSTKALKQCNLSGVLVICNIPDVQGDLLTLHHFWWGHDCSSAMAQQHSLAHMLLLLYCALHREVTKELDHSQKKCNCSQ